MDRSEKEKLVSEVRDALNASELLVVVKPAGLTVAESQKLRRNMREAKASYRVVKNRLARIALGESEFGEADGLFSGVTGMAFSPDPISAAKVAVDFASENEKLEVLGGAMPGKALTKADIEMLARLPSLDQLRGKLVGLLQAPATKLAQIARAPAGQLARLLSAYAQSKAT